MVPMIAAVIAQQNAMNVATMAANAAMQSQMIHHQNRRMDEGRHVETNSGPSEFRQPRGTPFRIVDDGDVARVVEE